MKLLFVSSGRQGNISPTIRNQGNSLLRAGVGVDFYVISGRGWKSYVKSIKPLRKQIKAGHYDVIHAHYSWSAYLASIASIGLHVPMIASLMGNDILDHWWYPLLARTVAAIKPWKAVIVKSKEMRNRVGIKRAFVVPNGVNMDVFNEREKESCQQHLGWDSGKKHVLFPATPTEARKNWSLAESAVNRLNMSGEYKIELHGMVGVTNNETPIWYNAADAVVLPSYYEGSPNAVKEAMACNTPIVTTDMGDCRERLEGVEGCYVANTYETDEFAELLSNALRHNGKTKGRERLIADGIADYQIAERLILIYKNIKK
ncbi:MAG: glycosyltransferase family 4 protein [Paludibacteraceae bacterium]|nr:glycosyltransferase family 4 protein [Paludibacteraceae bacterium]